MSLPLDELKKRIADADIDTLSVIHEQFLQERLRCMNKIKDIEHITPAEQDTLTKDAELHSQITSLIFNRKMALRSIGVDDWN